MNRRLHSACQALCLASTFLFSLFPSASLHAAACPSGIDLEAQTIWRSPTPSAAPTFRWVLPTSGLATVSLPGTGSVLALLDSHSDDCHRLDVQGLADVRIVEQSADRLVLAVRSAGSVHLSVAGKPISRLDTRFVAAQLVDRKVDVFAGIDTVQTSLYVASSDPASMRKDLEPEVVDPDPDGSMADTDRLMASWLSLLPVARQKDLEPEVVDPDPDGSAHGPLERSSALLKVLWVDPICRPMEQDDHGDTASCATPLALSRSLAGHLDNRQNDDVDVFSFEIRRASRVRIDLRIAGVGISYKLSSEAGKGLAMELLGVDREVGSASKSLVASLAPGRYFLRLHGPAATYSVQASVLD